MIKKSINLCLFAILILFGCKLSGQVTKLKYKLVYNDTTCNHDFYIHITQGNATTAAQRAQFNAQISVVVKAGTSILIDRKYMPLKDNQTYTGFIPMAWNIANVVYTPGAQPESDFYSITPGTLGTFYDNLAVGDSVRLFSIKVLTPSTECGSEIRLYINGVDPTSGEAGMLGSDFSQGFTIGGTTQDYDGNLLQIGPSIPEPEADIQCSDTGIHVDMITVDTSCHGPFTYEWTGPGISGSSSNADLIINNNNPGNNGTYKLVVSDAIGCSASFEYILENNPSAGADQSTCSGTSIDLAGAGADGIWSQANTNPAGATILDPNNPNTSVDFSTSASGEYKFYYAGLSCTDSILVMVSSHDAGPNPDYVNCNEDGVATLAAIGIGQWTIDASSAGTATILDPNSANTSVSGFSVPGTYYLNWTNGTCVEQVVVEVGSTCECPIDNNSINDPATLSYCESATGILITGSTPIPGGGTYLWEYSNNGVDFNPADGVNTNSSYTTALLNVGEHYFRRIYFTISGIICNDASNNVLITVHDNPVVTIDAIDPLCENGGTMNVAAFPGGGSFVGNGMSGEVFDPSSAGVGIHNITYMFTDVNNCSNTAMANIEVKAKPGLPSISNDGPKCFGETININADFIPSAQYNWSGPNGFNSTDEDLEILGLNDIKAGTYELTIVVNECTSDIATTNVVVKPIPDAPVTNNDGPQCQGDEIQLTADFIAGATYFWTGPNGFMSNDQNPILNNVTLNHAGEYAAYVKVDGCDGVEGFTTVNIKDKPLTPIASNDGPKCPGDVINFNASDVANANYQWVGPGFTANTQNPSIPNVSNTNVGTYKVVAIVDGCISDSAVTVLSLKATPTTPVPNNNGPVCENDTLKLYTPFLINADYAWTGPDGFTSIEQNPVIDFASSAKAGVYQVKVTVDGCESAEGSTTVVVKSKPAIPSISNNGPKCIGDDITLSTPNVPGANYSWRGVGTFISTSQNPVLSDVTPAINGDYFVKITINDCESDEAQTTVVVKDKPETPVAGNDSPKCFGENITLSASNVVGANYIWSGPNGFNRTEQNPVLASANITMNGTYFVKAVVDGCVSDSASTVIEVKSKPTNPIISNNSPVCEGDDLTFSTTSIAGVLYQWTGPNGFVNSNQNLLLTNATPAMSGEYKLRIVLNGCESDEVSINAIVKDKPNTPAINNNGPVCEGEDIHLNSTTTNGALYIWSGPNGFTSTEQNPSLYNVDLSANGSYIHYVTVDGCKSDETITNVIVNAKPNVSLQQPDAVCEDSPEIILIGNPAGGDYNGMGVSANLFSPSIALPGIHAVSYTFTDNNNCSNEHIIYIDVQQKPIASISHVDQLCEFGNEVPLFANPVGGEITGFGVNTLNQTFDPEFLSPGIYTVWYNWTDNVCSAEATMDIEIRANPIVTIDEVGQICRDAASIILTANPIGGSFDGIGVVGGEEFFPNIAGEGNHTITYTYADGTCTGTSSIDIEVVPTPNVGIDPVGEICVDGPDVTLSGFPFGITFSGNAVFGNVFSPALAGIGFHTVTGRYNDGLGCEVTTTLDINVKAKPVLSINDPGDVCETENKITLTANPTGGQFSGFYIENNDEFNVANAGVGNHTVTYNYDDGVCFSSTSIDVVVIAKPVIVVDEVGQICVDASSITLSATPNSGSFFGPGVSGTTFDPSEAGVGTKVIDYTITAGACTTTENISIEVTPSPVVTINDIPVSCIDGASVNLNASPLDGVFSGLGIENGNQFNPFEAGNGSHTITYTFDDHLGCIVSASTIASVQSKPVVTIDAIDIICETETEINLSGNPQGGNFTGNYVNNNKFDVTAAGVGNHNITYSYNDGICSNETSTTINVQAKPDITIDEVGQICKDATPVTLSATPAIGLFSGDGVENTNQFNPNALSVGNHVLSYTVSSGACTSTESIIIEVTATPVVSIEDITNSCIDGANIILNALPLGGVFTGNGIENGNQFNPVTAGVGPHVVTYTFNDNLGCIVSDNTTATVQAKPVVNIAPIPDVCETENEILLIGTPAGGAFTGNFILANDKFDVASAGVGSHNVTYTYNDGICSNSISQTIKITAKPTIDIEEVGKICRDAQAITLVASPAGSFTGTGVIPGNKFNPVVAGIGNHEISYTVVSGACTATSSIFIEVTTPPTVSIDAVSDVCKDGITIPLNVIPLGGTFNGNGVENNHQFNPVTAGVGSHIVTYTYTELGCTINESIEINVQDKPVVTIQPVDQLCVTGNPISLIANLTPGTFSGSGILGSLFDPAEANSGIHTINYEYSNGVCSNTATVNIEVLDQVNAGNDIDLSCVILANASTKLEGTGSGKWEQIANTAVLFDDKNISNPLIRGFAQAGTYVFEYSNGVCKDQVSVEVSAKPNAGNDIGNVKCYTIGATALNGIGAGTWTLASNSSGTANFDVNNANTPVTNFSINGTYYFVWTINGCTDTVSINVGNDCACPIENNIINAPNPKDFCETTGSLILDGGAVSQVGDYLWQYSNNNGAFTNAAGINNTRTYDASNLGVGNHKFRRSFNTTSGIICTDTSNVIELNVYAKPLAVSVSSNSPVCSGDEINITAQDVAGTTYKWFDPSGLEYNTKDIHIAAASESNEGLYRLFITKDNCVSDVISLSVVVNDKPALPGIDPINAVCEGETIGFNSNVVADSYEWTLNGSVISTDKTFNIPNADLSDAGNYNLTVSNEGCESDPSSVLVIINAKPAKPILNSNSPVCEGQNVNINFVNSISGLQYFWTTPNGPFNTKDINITSANSSHEGTYTLFVTKNGCQSESTSVDVEVSAKFNAPAILGDITVCEGENIELSTDATGATYEWTLPNNSTSALQTISFANANKTIHEGEYKLKIYKDGCESETATVNVVVNNNPSSPLVDPVTAICEGNILSFNTPTVADAYEWSVNSVVLNTNKSFDILNADINDAGSYTLVVTVNGCKSQPTSVAAIVNANPAKPILKSNSPVCEGQVISIVLMNNETGLSYSWTTPNGPSTGKDINITSANASHAGDYTLSVSKNGCVSESTTVSVEVSNKFSAPIVLGDLEICEGETITLSTSADATQYEWLTPRGVVTTSTISFTNATAADAGAYSLKISKDGCESETANVAVVVNNRPLAPTIDAILPICKGETLLFNTTAVADVYSWKVNGVEVSNQKSFEILNASDNDAVEYSLSISLQGCESNVSNITPIVKETPAKPILSSNSPVCEGQSISILHTNGEVDLTYFWVTPLGNAVTKDIIIVSANASHVGEYVLYVEKEGCRSESTSIQVEVSDKSQAPSIVGNLIICEGQNINLSTSNIADNFVWTLPDNSTVSDAVININNATTAHAGTYKLEIENDGCKSETAVVVVSVNSKLLAPTILPVNAVCEGEDINLNAETINGASYAWTGPNNFSVEDPLLTNVSDADAGIYTLVITKDGCQSEAATVEIIVKDAPAKPILSTNSPVCEGQAVSILHTNGETGMTYFWSTPTGTVSSKDINITSADASHVGTYTLFVEQDGCKSEISTVEVEVSDKSQAPTIEGKLTLCEGQTIFLSTRAIADNFLWTLPNNTTTTSSTINILNADGANAGTYKLEIEKDGCKSETAEVFVSINDKLAAPVINPIAPICEGQDVSFNTSTIADQYSWQLNGVEISDEKSFVINNANLSDNGIYTLIISTNDCEGEPSNVTVTINETPEKPVLPADLNVCIGDDTVITPTVSGNNVNYIWTLPNGTTSNQNSIDITNANQNNEGTYVLVLESNNCFSDDASVALIVNPLPIAAISGDEIYCEGQTINFVAIGNNSLNIDWKGPNGFNQKTAAVVIANANVTHGGSYVLEVTDVLTNCKSEAVDIDIIVNAKPATPTISGEEKVCANKSIQLHSEFIDGAIYTWKGPNGYSSNERNIVIEKANIANAGKYELFVMVDGCISDPAALEIEVENCSCNISDNNITSDVAAFCNRTEDFIIEASTPLPAGGIIEWQYKDDKSEYSAAKGINNQINYTSGNLGLGSHYFRRLYTFDNEGFVCTDTTEALEINVLDNTTDYIDLDFDPKSPCVGDTMMIAIQNEIPGVTYNWTVTEDEMDIIVSNNRLAYFSPEASGTYHILVTQNVPGCGDSEPLVQEINVFANPRVNLGYDTVFCHLDGEFEIELEEEYTSYLWSDGSENSSLIIDEKGTYSVTVTDENGCESVDEIRIKEFCCKIFYPNIVNMQEGAVSNNLFKLVDNGCVLTSKLRIYDRWGNLVYQSNLGLEPWDGKFNGKLVDQGVYAFLFTYTALDEDDQEFNGKVKGDVTILR